MRETIYEIGDRVYCHRRGEWGRVSIIDMSKARYPVFVYFKDDDTTNSYTIDGRPHIDCLPVLYYTDEPLPIKPVERIVPIERGDQVKISHLGIPDRVAVVTKVFDGGVYCIIYYSNTNEYYRVLRAKSEIKLSDPHFKLTECTVKRMEKAYESI